MLPSSNSSWLMIALQHIKDKSWLRENLDNAFTNLPDHLNNPHELLAGTAILDAIVDVSLDVGRYSPLKRLLLSALDNFQHMVPPANDNDFLNHIDQAGTFAEQNPTEYFRIRLNLAHVYLTLREIHDSRRLIYALLNELDTVDGINQLDTYCLILKFFGYGNHMNLDFDVVHEATELAIKRYPHRRLGLYIAIAYFHFSQGDPDKVKNMLDKISRIMAEEVQVASINMLDVNRISAEQNYFLAVIYRDLHDFDMAAKYLERASEQYARLENPIRNMLMLYEKAVLFRFLDETEAAEQWLKLAYDEYHNLAEPQTFHLAMLNHTYGLIYVSLKDYKTALKMFQSTLPEWHRADHKYHTALTYNAIGYCLYELGQIDDALEHYDIAKAKCSVLNEVHARGLMRIIDENIKNAKNHFIDN